MKVPTVRKALTVATCSVEQRAGRLKPEVGASSPEQFVYFRVNGHELYARPFFGSPNHAAMQHQLVALAFGLQFTILTGIGERGALQAGA